MNLDELVKKITNTPEFLCLKKVVENNPYHDREDAYSHSLATYQIAQNNIKGEFITNSEAKKLFEEFLNERVTGWRKEDLLILIALLHDFGKSLFFEENGQTESILSIKPNGDTQCSGHEYWGSVFVKDFLKQFGLPQEVIEYISTIIRLHDSLSTDYFNPKLDWPIELIIKDLKSRAEGFYKEALFNVYCDNFKAENLFDSAKKIIEQIFSNPFSYTPRRYTLE